MLEGVGSNYVGNAGASELKTARSEIEQELFNYDLPDGVEIGDIDLSDDAVIRILKGESITDIIKESVEQKLEDLNGFSDREAEIYAEGEAEIQKMIEKEKSKAGVKIGLVMPFESEEDIEKRCRDKYAAKHPEYKKVMEEGQAVEKEFEEAKDKEMAKWLIQNPPPVINQITNAILGIQNKEMKEWQENYEEAQRNFEEDYTKNNPDYANLKEAEKNVAKKKPIIRDINLIDIPQVKPHDF